MFSSNITFPFVKVMLSAVIIWIGLVVGYYVTIYRVYSQKSLQAIQPIAVITKPVPQYAQAWQRALAANPVQIKQQLLTLLSAMQLVRFHFGSIEQQHLLVTIVIDESFSHALDFLIRLMQLPFIFELEKLDWTGQQMILQLNFLMES